MKEAESLKKYHFFSDLLGVAERLTKWADYDSATGWGKISAVSAGGHIVISVSHQKLFTNDDEDGSVFQYFLAGYSETVLNRILAGKIGKVVLSRVFNENETAKIEFTTEE